MILQRISATMNVNQYFLGGLLELWRVKVISSNGFFGNCYKTYQHSIAKKPINAHWSALLKNSETNSKNLGFSVGCRVRFTKYNIIFSKGHTNC